MTAIYILDVIHPKKFIDSRSGTSYNKVSNEGGITQ